ncbi:MAG: RNA ligase RtcB family protein [Epsilonproteobacteria bacterium]|nr:RNA ligase RtcB family protein [Campylobacterota bacterium]
MNNLKIIASKRNWIDQRSVETLKQITTYRGVQNVVGLPDLSVGSVPNGMAVMSKDVIYPHLIGGDIGCGMSLFALPIKSKKIKIDRFEKRLLKLNSLSDIEIDTPLNEHNLGTIGRGNHFVELHQLNSGAMDKDMLYILVHSGSRSFGQMVFDSVATSYKSDEGIEIKSPLAKAYMRDHDRAQSLAKKSRLEIVQRVLKALNLEGKLSCISDTAHNSITQVGDLWLHRKGATPTDKGLVAIAGSRGTLSYLVKPLADTTHANYSLAHGAGRKWERNSVEAKLKKLINKQQLLRTAIGARVICHDSSLLYQEVPQAYKDIDIVIDDLVRAKLAEVVATFRPILTYKE